MTSWKIGGEGGDAFPFEKIGDSVTGTVVNVADVQQTDMDTNQPAFWDNGDKKMMSKVSLQTTLAEHPGDSGLRTVYLRGAKKPGSGSSLSAVIDAVTAAGGTNELQHGGTLTLTYTGDGPQERRGFNKPKKYTALYVPAVYSLNGGSPAAASAAGEVAPTQPAPAVAPPAAAPAPAPAPAPVPVAAAPAPATVSNGSRPTITAVQFASLAAAGLDVSGFDVAG